MSDFTVLGDAHLGRRFTTGVPLHRIGDREALVWADFEKSLADVITPLHVNLGDIYDKFVVPPEIVIRSALLYRAAAEAKPLTTFVVIRGNHDVSRDLVKQSSFELFELLVEGVANIVIVSSEPLVQGNYGFVPFDPFKSAVEQIRLLPDGLDRIFTHFDYVDWGGDHVLPTALLAEKGILKVTNGHDHLARIEKRHGVEVTLHGSLQPYTHAEDADGLFYKTVTLDELVTLDTTNLNIRVLLQPGEVLPEDIDCLSLTAKKLQGSLEETSIDTEEFDSFDLAGELSNLLPESIRAEVMEVFHQ